MQRPPAYLLALAGGLVAGGVAVAGPLDPRVIAPDAKWAGHFDMQAAMASSVGRFICTTKSGHVKLDELDALRAKLGLDPLTEMHGLTLYGSNGSEPVFIITATTAADGLIERLPQIAQGHEAVVEGDRTIHSWSDGENRQYCAVLPAPDPLERRVVISPDRDRLLSALAVIENPDAEPPAMRAQPGEGSIFYFTSLDVEAMGWLKPASKVAQNTKAFTVDVGERAGQLYGELELTAKSEEQAQNIVVMGQGIIAMLKWGNQGRPETAEVQKLADAIGLSVSGAQVKASWRFDCAQLLEIVEKSQKKPHDQPSDSKPAERAGASGGK